MSRRFKAGLLVAVIAVSAAISLRVAIASPADAAIYDFRSEVTGIDFGEWPLFFYTSAGGDGEVFAVMTADLLLQGPALTIRSTVFRYTRIGYPILTRAITLGKDTLILPGLALVGIVSLALVAFAAGWYRDALGWKSWFLVCNPAMFMGFAGDTAEPLAVLTLLIALTANSVVAAVCMALVRPSFVAALVGRWTQLAAATVAAFTIRLAAVLVLGGSLFAGTDGNLAFPLAGYVERPSILALVVGASGLATVVAGMWHRDWSWIGAGFLVLSFGPVVLDDPANAVRAAGLLPVLWAFGPNFRSWVRSTEVRSVDPTG